MTIMDRMMCLRDVASALSRYDGHTTFVRLERILALPLSDDFADDSSVYATQLIRSLINTGVGEVAARRHVDHAIALGLLHRVSAPGETVRVADTIRKVDVTSRVALSPTARAFRAASSLGDEGFRDFLLTCNLLQYDFDMYGLVLNCARTPPLTLQRFIDTFRQTVRIRGIWVDDMHPVIKSQLFGLVPWMNRDIRDRSLTHHFNLRRSWAISMGHLCPSGSALTDLGEHYAGSLPDDTSVFWLAPQIDCIERLRLSPPTYATAPSTSWELLAPSSPDSEPTSDVVDAVGGFMLDAFNHLRMHLFRQAPITAVIPFVHYAKYRLADPAPPFDILQSVVKRGDIDCMLSRVIEDCYYRIPTHRQRS